MLSNYRINYNRFYFTNTLSCIRIAIYILLTKSLNEIVFNIFLFLFCLFKTNKYLINGSHMVGENEIVSPSLVGCWFLSPTPFPSHSPTYSLVVVVLWYATPLYFNFNYLKKQKQNCIRLWKNYTRGGYDCTIIIFFKYIGVSFKYFKFF